MAIQIQKLEGLLAGLRRMSPREKIMVSGAAIALALFLGFLISMGISSKLSAIERRIAEKSSKVQAIMDLRQQYQDAKERQKQSQDDMKAGKNVQLLTVLETLAKQLGVSIGDMKKTPPMVDPEIQLMEEKVDVSIPLITIDRLVDFLRQVEGKSKTITVRKLRIQQSFRENTQLEVSLTVSNFQSVEEKPVQGPGEKKPETASKPSSPSPETPTPGSPNR
jgi:general secretion pathway protein M